MIILKEKVLQIKQFLLKIFNREKFFLNFRKYAIFFCSIFILLGSGYCFFSINTDSIYGTICSLITFIFSFILYFLLEDWLYIKGKIIKKKVDFSFLFLFCFSLLVCISMLVNKETNSIILYLGFLLNVFNGYLLSKLISLYKVLDLISDILFYLTLIGIFSYLIYLFSKVDPCPPIGVTNFNNQYFSNFFFLNFIYVNKPRFQSIFWESGVYCTFALISIIRLLFNFKKQYIIKILFFVLGILLSESTFGIICLFVVIVLFCYRLIKNKNHVISILFAISFFACVLVLIIFYNPIINFLSTLFPTIFDKLVIGNHSSISFSTRILCPYIDIDIFLQSPIFGVGLSKYGHLFNTAIESEQYLGLVDSQTTTTTMMLASFGVFGFLPTVLLSISLFFSKKYDIIEKIFFFFLYLIILNKEPHIRILFDWFLLFSLIEMNLNKNETGLLSKETSQNALLKIFVSKDDSAVVKKNVFLSFVVKGVALVVSFVSTPVFNLYFGKSLSGYGLWITILSIVTWITNFDFGLGNGLKNKLIEAGFPSKNQSSNKLIWGTYYSTFFLSIIFISLGLPFIWMFDVSKLFANTTISLISLRICLTIILLSIIVEFNLRNINYIFQSMQKQLFANIPPLITSILLLIFIFFIRIPNENYQLITLCVFYFFALNIPYIIGHLYLIKKHYISHPIHFKEVLDRNFKKMFNLSIGFFIVQICLMIINSLNNILISSNFGSEFSALYEYYNKFYMMLYSLFSMLTLPYWSMIVKANKEGNKALIKRMFKQLIIFSLIFLFASLLIYFSLQLIFDLWINDSLVNPIKVNYLINSMFLLNFWFLMVISFTTTFLNGFNIVKQQIIAFIIGVVCKGLSTFLLLVFLKEHLGWVAIVISNVISLLVISLILVIYIVKAKVKNEKKEKYI